jgi:outer membrane protein assembly factor BamD
MLVAIDDAAVVSLARLFNEKAGRAYLTRRGVPEALTSQLDLLGFSGIGNLLSTIKMAKYYELGEKESAKDAAETFIRENPTHPRIDYAWYLQGLIDFERVPNSLERWLGVDMTQRPPTGAREAFTALRTVVQRYPTSAYAHDARRRMIYLRNRLADFEINVAHHYEERGAWVAAAQRARQTIEQYDGAPAVKEALRVLVRCYRKLDYKELEENTVKVFRENYPEDSLEISRVAGKPWWKFWGS